MRKLCFMLVPLLVAACTDTVAPPEVDGPLFAGVPADGNGNKDVFDFSGGPFPVVCDGEELALDVVGWGQFKVYGPPKNRNVELGVFHLVLTYTNAAGDTFVWRDVGPDHFYVDGGELFVTITGRSTASGTVDRDEIVVGHVVLNLTTNEVVFVAGRELGSVDAMACNALT